MMDKIIALLVGSFTVHVLLFSGEQINLIAFIADCFIFLFSGALIKCLIDIIFYGEVKQ